MRCYVVRSSGQRFLVHCRHLFVVGHARESHIEDTTLKNEKPNISCVYIMYANVLSVAMFLLCIESTILLHATITAPLGAKVFLRDSILYYVDLTR
jgi:hypothetical protein